MRQIGPYPTIREQQVFQSRARSRHGRTVLFMGYKAPYNFLIDGKWRVAFKFAGATKSGSTLIWNFSIHRHGKLKEDCDLYVFRLLDVPYSKAAINLLVRAPIGRKTFEISFRQLLNGASTYVQDFKSLMRGELSNEK